LPVPEASSHHETLRDAVQEGGALALEHYKKGVLAWRKDDDTPVTEADLAVDHLLKQRLRAAEPDYGWLSEETEDDEARLTSPRQWMVDPIDGTRAFIKGRPHFAVVGAVIEGGRPISGVIYNPATDELFEAETGGGAFLNGAPIHVSDVGEVEGCRILGAEDMFRHPAWPQKWPEMHVEQRNSIAYRGALVAAGDFDAMLVMNWKNDWDLAAADLIVHEAGGKMTTHSGQTLTYNKPDPRHRSVVAAGPALYKALDARIGQIVLPG